MSQGRTDSDLDDVWSDVSGEVDRGAELTEFDFNPPSKKQPEKQPEKKPEAPKPRPPLTSDLEMPALGSMPEPVPPKPIPPPPPFKPPTLEIGAVLEGSSASSLLSDVRIEKRAAPETDNRTMIGDAESAAIARVVSRSLLTGVQSVNIPPVLERDDVSKVLMGQRSEGEPVPPPLPAPDEEEVAEDPLTDPPLELAYDPHDRASTPAPPPPRPLMLHEPRPTFSMRWVVLILAAIVIIAAGVRLFVH